MPTAVKIHDNLAEGFCRAFRLKEPWLDMHPRQVRDVEDRACNLPRPDKPAWSFPGEQPDHMLVWRARLNTNNGFSIGAMKANDPSQRDIWRTRVNHCPVQRDQVCRGVLHLGAPILTLPTWISSAPIRPAEQTAKDRR
ncbi:hypothetical protein KPL78_29770 [Roseomonas sp. HJA6]|uniref:Uncharacterized protein n=1 Tax=Roseomonas alba TaxID=2846776 RepID=A0ABS7AIB9_9PROT|nr:hypothetical protein [Neoroseomonas alba]MBW6402072.1 hypothetical protein [Neoroseomonas alba]